MKKEKGFTIIELIVIIAVIAVLSAIVSVNANSYMSKTRDSKRIADLVNIQKALELYYIDHNSYPPAPCGYNCSSSQMDADYYFSADSSWTTLETYLKDYIFPLPKDPINNGALDLVIGTTKYSYAYGRSYNNIPPSNNIPSNIYGLWGVLETPNHPLSCGKVCYKYWYDRGLSQMCRCPQYALDKYSPQIFGRLPY